MSENRYSLIIDFNSTNEDKTSQKKVQSNQEKVLNQVTNIAKTQAILPFANTLTNVYFNNLQTSTGSSQLVERQRLLVDGVKQGVNLYQAGAGGIAFASAIGLSTGAGLGIGVGLYVLNTIFSLWEKQNQLNNQRKIENYNIQYAQSRMGTAYNKSRTDG